MECKALQVGFVNLLVAKVQAQLFEEYERQNSLRSQSHKGGHVTLEESQWAKFRRMPDDIPQTIILSGFGIH